MKIYEGQRLTVQLDCGTDVSAGAPALEIEFLKPDGTTTLLKTATLVNGSTTAIEYTLTGAETAGGAGKWRAQSVITEAGQPAWRGDTVTFTINKAFA